MLVLIKLCSFLSIPNFGIQSREREGGQGEKYSRVINYSQLPQNPNYFEFWNSPDIKVTGPPDVRGNVVQKIVFNKNITDHDNLEDYWNRSSTLRNQHNHCYYKFSLVQIQYLGVTLYIPLLPLTPSLVYYGNS